MMKHSDTGQEPLRRLLHLPEAAWPEEDRQRFAAAFAQPQDIFSDDGGGSHLKPRTKSAIRFGYRRWLGWIAAHRPELLTADPRTRATAETIRSYATHLRLTCRERALATQVRLLHDALRYMYPTDDWFWLRETKARLERAIPKAGRKPILTTSQAVVDASLARLDEVDAAYDELPPAAGRKTRQALALRYRDGLLVALASFFPLRRSNLAALMVGTTLRHRGEAWWIHIPGEDAKNGEPLDAELPVWIGERVDRFVQLYRPLIHGSGSHNGLWASAKGQAATGDALYNAYQKEIESSLEMRATLHDARRIASTTWAIHDPVNAAGAKDLLGDRSDRVFAQHYNLANGIEASRTLAQIVKRLKERPT